MLQAVRFLRRIVVGMHYCLITSSSLGLFSSCVCCLALVFIRILRFRPQLCLESPVKLHTASPSSDDACSIDSQPFFHVVRFSVFSGLFSMACFHPRALLDHVASSTVQTSCEVELCWAWSWLLGMLIRDWSSSHRCHPLQISLFLHLCWLHA